MSETPQQRENSLQYLKGDVVWAKVTGYPWWPGRIRKISTECKYKKINKNIANDDSDNELTKSQKVYTVAFFGDTTHIKVPITKIMNYEENYDKNIIKNRKKLMTAVTLADKYIQRKKDENKRKGRSSESSPSIELSRKRKRSSSSYSNSDSESSESNINNSSSSEEEESSNPKKSYSKEKKNKYSSSDSEEEKCSIRLVRKEKESSKRGSKKESSEDKKDKGFSLSTPSKKENKNQKGLRLSSSLSQGCSSEVKSIYIVDESMKDDTPEQSEEENDSQIEKDRFNKLRSLGNEMMKDAINSSCHYNLNNLLKNLDLTQQIITDLQTANTDVNTFYYETKELLKVLESLTYNRKSEVVTKAIDVNGQISQFFVSSMFEWKENELKEFILKKSSTEGNLAEKMNLSIKKYLSEDEEEKEEEIPKETQKEKETTQRESPKESTKLKSILKPKPKKVNLSKSQVIIQPEMPKENSVEDIYKIFKMDTQKAINEFNKMSGPFFKDVYTKNPHLNVQNCIIRKRVCNTILKRLQKFLPTVNVEDLQKISIYTEYNSRNGGKELDKKYCQNIKNFCHKIDEIFLERKEHKH
ncbi:MAG: PWWP domain-containing protein [archaeon]|nr:PWWP domain-containing protein [archaeon]